MRYNNIIVIIPQVDPSTGMVINLTDMKHIIQVWVIVLNQLVVVIRDEGESEARMMAVGVYHTFTLIDRKR